MIRRITHQKVNILFSLFFPTNTRTQQNGTQPKMAPKTTHTGPTHQAISQPLTDLAAFIEAIPAAITIENVEFSVHQTNTFN